VPANGSEERAPLSDTTQSISSNVVGVTPALESWRIAWPNDAKGVVGNATLWVDIQGQVYNPPPTDECFWDLAFTFLDGTTAVGFSTCAGTEPAQVPPGPRRLDVSFRFEGDVPTDSELTIEISAGTGPHGQDTERVLLVGSAEHDSSITFQGVTFPSSG
jgi:hypothetical protein